VKAAHAIGLVAASGDFPAMPIGLLRSGILTHRSPSCTVSAPRNHCKAIQLRLLTTRHTTIRSNSVEIRSIDRRMETLSRL